MCSQMAKTIFVLLFVLSIQHMDATQYLIQVSEIQDCQIYQVKIIMYTLL